MSRYNILQIAVGIDIVAPVFSVLHLHCQEEHALFPYTPFIIPIHSRNNFDKLRKTISIKDIENVKINRTFNNYHNKSDTTLRNDLIF